MTDDQADELLKNNDWAKWSDARELLMEAAHMGAMDERKNLDAKLRRLASVEQQRDELLEALRSLINICTHPNSTKAEMKQIAEESRKAIAAATKD